MDQQTLQAFLYQAMDWVVQAIPNLIAAIIILIFGFFIARWVSRLAGELIGARIDPTLTPIITALLRYLVLFIALIAVLGQLGIQIASLLAVLGAAGLAIGLALQGTLSNIAAGIMLLALRPFRVGEAIEAGDISGTIVEVGLFATHLRSPDGLFRFVPNADLWNTPIVNYSRNPTRRIEIALGIDYDDEIRAAQRILTAMLEEDPRVLKDPAPQVVVTALGPSSVDLALRFWVASADFGTAGSDLIACAKERIAAAGLSIPFPQQVVRTVTPLAIAATEKAGRAV